MSSIFSADRPEILLDGQVQADLNANLLSLLVEETTAGLYRCELTVANVTRDGQGGKYLFADRSTIDFGKALSVQVTGSAGDATIFTGNITGLEGRFPLAGAPQFALLAEDKLQDLRMARHSRTFTEQTDQQIISTVVQGAGLSLSGSVDGPQYPVVVQVNQSDLAFIRERARVVDAELWLQDDAVHLQQRSSRKSGPVTLQYKAQLLECSVLADMTAQRTQVQVAGWDVATKKEVIGTATASAVTAELGEGKSGAALLSSAFADRQDQVFYGLPGSQDEVQAIATAAFCQMARRFVSVSGVAVGDGRIRVGVEVDLQDISDTFSGVYYVTEVRHLYDTTHGYRTQFRAERPWIGG